MEFAWNRSNVQALIELYEQHECLYNVRSKDYMNRDIKAAALNNILEAMRQNNSGITLDAIKKKFKGLRSQFSYELKLLQSKRKSGMGIDDEYVPKFWCFQQLSFLKTHLKMREGVSNTDDLSSSFIEYCSGSDTSVKKKAKKKRSLEDGLDELQAVLEKKVATKCKYDWLGKKVMSVLEEIEGEDQVNAVFEIESVFNKYWRNSIQKRRPATSCGPSSSHGRTSSDILQLSMEGILDEYDSRFFFFWAEDV